ncbi:hypothetical protein HanRHA438_Chr06g0269411 [Helianthus annuus]|nr:hypothetical protein HanRHA438_Chr06g0269411 [Helianthus annuus]
MTSAMLEGGEGRRREEERRKELGTARRVREERWERAAATVVAERRAEKSERSGKGDKRWVMLTAEMVVVVWKSKYKEMKGVKWEMSRDMFMAISIFIFSPGLSLVRVMVYVNMLKAYTFGIRLYHISSPSTLNV